ncbi:MAG: tRNA (adenosine(37)-N6)-dimethylallyltransferase MiaA [Chloroflexota bacterium]
MAIVGPTAVGKSDLALRIAGRRSAEIVSADSRQVYRGLEIGTAKPTLDEQRRVAHHLIDVVDPGDDFSLAEFQERAYRAIDQILGRGHLPLLVGGTGLYVRAVVDGVQLPRVAPDPTLRRELEAFARERGADTLHHRLADLDPRAASRIDARNLRRVVRAIEVVEKSGRLFSDFQGRQPRYDVLTIGLARSRDDLYRRIDQRVDRQIEDGLIEETRRVIEAGCSPERPALAGLGYREIAAYLGGTLDLGSAIERIKFETHRFARQQANWFRLNDPLINWLDAGATNLEASLALIDRRCGRDLNLAMEASG